MSHLSDDMIIYTMKTILTFLYLGIATCYAQNNLKKSYEAFELKNANDSEGTLDAGMVYSIRLKSSPKGKGEQVELTGSAHLFPEENNVAWLRFTTLKTSRLTIRIVPDSTQDDYDFLLFKDEGEQTLSRIQKKIQKPLRSNCARTQNIDQGITGLAYDSDLPEHVGTGTGSSYSRFLEVNRGEQYYLVLNNVYDNGAGVSVFLEYWDAKELSGTITDENNTPQSVVITWEDKSTGDTLAQTTSNENGYFRFTVPYSMQSESGYSLVASSDSLIFSQTDYSVGDIATCSSEPITLVLKELKKGSTMTLGSINFEGDKAIFLKNAYPSLKRLYKLLKYNPDMTIRIEGHTNGSSCPQGCQLLSEQRAIAVKDYLVEKGVESSRVTTLGHGGRFMLFPYDSKDAFRNRRVEIIVTNY